MSFGEAIRSVFSKYATFSGRARRSEYWWFYLFTILLGIGAGILDTILASSTATAGAPATTSGPIAGLVQLAIFLPQLAVTVRRLHDTNHSGWILLGFVLLLVVAIGIIAVIAIGPEGVTPTFNGTTGALAGLLLLGVLGYGIYLFVLLVSDSTPGDNDYGVNPKGPKELVGGTV
jgi:uncharacterized membrane protein YhaH (DUF805 family)